MVQDLPEVPTPVPEDQKLDLPDVPTKAPAAPAMASNDAEVSTKRKGISPHLPIGLGLSAVAVRIIESNHLQMWAIHFGSNSLD